MSTPIDTMLFYFANVARDVAGNISGMDTVQRRDIACDVASCLSTLILAITIVERVKNDTRAREISRRRAS